MTDCFSYQMDEKALGAVSSLGLAHVGDAVYELLVRSFLVSRGLATAKGLHRQTVELVRAGTQARLLERCRPLLTKAEAAVCRRARNAHTHMIPKSASPEEYHAATALEALLGWLYLQGQRERLGQLFAHMMEEVFPDAP